MRQGKVWAKYNPETIGSQRREDDVNEADPALNDDDHRLDEGDVWEPDPPPS
jgi:hypothetical protein